EAERAAGGAEAELEEPLPRQAVTGLLCDLCDQQLLLRMLVRRVRLNELLGHDQLLRDDDERRGDREEAEPEREPEELRLARDRIDRVDDDERDGERGPEEEQDERQ